MLLNVTLKIQLFNSVNIDTIPRFITGEKTDIWDKTCKIEPIPRIGGGCSERFHNESLNMHSAEQY